MIKDKHSSYTSNDFLNNQSFLNAIKHKKQVDVDYWNVWQASKPNNIAEYRAASVELKLMLSPKRITSNEGFLENLWNDIEHTIERDDLQRKTRLLRFRLMSAAAIVLLCVSVTLWYFNSTITILTNYGQTKEVTLPDGTHVTLNANSEFKYARAYSFTEKREIYLKGEGYFNVTKGKRFVVYLKNINIQVLGTAFNIKERRGITKVVLVRGSIAIHQNSPALHQITLLRPSELYTYNEKISNGKKNIVNPTAYVAWLDQKAILENTRIGDVIADYEDTYGQKIILEDNSLYERKIDGVIPTDNKENTLFVIANILNLRAEKKGDTILLKPYK